MRPKSLLLLMLALGCGAVASIGINQVLANRRTTEVVRPGETVSVFVPLDDIPSNEPITAALVKIEEWPKDKVPPGTLTKLEDLEGRRTRTKLFPGQPIMEQMLLGVNESMASASGDIPPGMRVVAVQVNHVTSGRLAQIGDRVDVLVHLSENPNLGVARTITRTFLQNIKVFAVDDVFQREDDENARSGDAKTVSLLVTPNQAELVTLASEMGEIRLVLRSADDKEDQESTGVTPDQLLRGLVGDQESGQDQEDEGPDFLSMLKGVTPPQPPAETTLHPGLTVMVPPKPAWTMRLFQGTRSEQIEFNEEGEEIVGPQNPLRDDVNTEPFPGTEDALEDGETETASGDENTAEPADASREETPAEPPAANRRSRRK